MAERKIALRIQIDWSNHLPESREVSTITREAIFEAKASEQSGTAVGGRRVIVVAGERSIRNNNR
jgi:hypothetical protein